MFTGRRAQLTAVGTSVTLVGVPLPPLSRSLALRQHSLTLVQLEPPSRQSVFQTRQPLLPSIQQPLPRIETQLPLVQQTMPSVPTIIRKHPRIIVTVAAPASATLSGRHTGRVGDTWVLHIDLDQFFASVEVLRRPELRGRPVVVGGSGDPTKARTVVATASREAREFGVHSGMPMRLAARKCPDAVFLPSDMPAYVRASARVMATLRTFPVRLEVYGLDEAFVGGDIDDPQRLAADLKTAVHDQVGLTCAVGVGRNKHQAKIAARFAKKDPAGIATLTDETWMTVMGQRSVGDLWGVGPKTVTKLDELGLPTIAELAAAELETLLQRFHCGPPDGCPSLLVGAATPRW